MRSCSRLQWAVCSRLEHLEAEKGEFQGPARFLLFPFLFSPGPQLSGTVPPPSRVGLPTSVTPLWRQPHRHIQRCVSQEIPNPVPLTRKMTVTGENRGQPEASTICPFRKRHSRLSMGRKTQGEEDVVSTVFLIHLLFPTKVMRRVPTHTSQDPGGKCSHSSPWSCTSTGPENID